MSDDDLEEDALGEETSFDEFGQQNTLGDLWRNNPLVKVGIILAAGAAIFGTIILFGGEEEELKQSVVPPGTDVSAPPGTETATPTYVEAIEEFNEAEREKALATGGSVLPVPIEPAPSRLEAPIQEEEAEDPLQRWRRLQEERLKREVTRRETVRPQQIPEQGAGGAAANRNEAIQALADAMSQQMQSILESRNKATGIQQMQMTSPAWLEAMKKEEEIKAAEEAAKNKPEMVEEIIVPAGEIVYAQLLTEANSDIPGPVLAQLVAGPLKGSRILGSFSAEEDGPSEHLVLEFNTIVIDGVSQSISAVAIDPDTTLPGMASEVDHHYFKRIVLPMAAAFVEGVAEATAKTTTTVVTVDGAAVESEEDADSEQEISFGVEKAGEELRTILDDMAEETDVTIIVYSGTPMGILFLEPVTQEKENM